ncbi:MAG: glycosyltransferase family 4 protein, partial [Ignavibacteria bacterium]|nr:glycosyltransferase family 4 protein [Ignavibacteria bacterium]
MRTYNWIIIKSKDRGIEYGVGTFIKQLSETLVLQNNIDVFIIEVGIDTINEFTLERKSGIYFFRFPNSKYIKETDTKSNHTRFAKSIVRVVSHFLPKNRVNIVHLNFVFQYFIGTAFKETFDCRLIFTQHLFIPESNLDTNTFNPESQIYSLVDRIITVTNHGMDHLIKKGIDKEKITPIYNGIDPTLFGNKSSETYIRQKYGIGLNEKIVLYSGRIDPIKGLKYLTRSFSRLLKELPNCRLVIAGNGNFEELIRHANAFSSNINYLGFIPFEDLISLYQTASIGVIPSLEEHCSYVALEMLYSGLPAVASNLGGLKEIFIHKENAFLVDTEPDSTNIYGIAPNIDQFAGFMYNL